MKITTKKTICLSDKEIELIRVLPLGSEIKMSDQSTALVLKKEYNAVRVYSQEEWQGRIYLEKLKANKDILLEK